MWATPIASVAKSKMPPMPRPSMAREMDAQISNGNQVGADNQVLLAIRQYITAYNLTVNASGNSPAFLQSAVYVNEAGSTTYGSVGATSSNQIPSGAAGVRVSVQEPWTD